MKTSSPQYTFTKLFNKPIKYNNILSCSLYKHDTELYSLMCKEEARQKRGIQLIASENIASNSVRECLGSVLTNKYSEGYPGKRYYGGNNIIDEIENLAIKRTLDAFKLDYDEWSVNVQPYSGSSANMAVYLGLLQPHDRIMGLSLKSGGHLTHGHYTAKRNVSASAIIYEALPYEVHPDTELIDYEKLESMALSFRPNLLICGYSAYSRDLDYEYMRTIADRVGAYLMCDMAHFSGFVAAGEFKSPFEYCDIVTTTTHKTLGGPRAGMIFSKKDLKSKIDFGVFPALQGGPHQNKIAAIATQMKHVQSDEYKKYIQQVKRNAQALAETMMGLGYHVCTEGTDNHIVLIDLNQENTTGKRVEDTCNSVNIYINKNSVPSDISVRVPGGIRLGTSYMTSMGFKEDEFKTIAYYLDECIQISSLKTKRYDGDLFYLKEEIEEFNGN